MPPRQKTPAPIDKPLSRAYLREFTGWSTAYPPGISDPTSLRVMENVMINRDGSARVRPGLRHMSYEDVGGVLEASQLPVVGTHEPFFLNDGSKAYLFAVREADSTVGFRVLSPNGTGTIIQSLTAAGFTFPVSEANVAFSAKTTWVKYLQIDNKIFALSDAGETMRLFCVGDEKTAKKMSSISRPDWATTDKLSVVHPDAAWLSGTIPTSVRTNLAKQADMDVTSRWVPNDGNCKVGRSSAMAHEGTYSLRIESLPERTNFVPRPLHDVATTGTVGWSADNEALSVAVSGSYLQLNIAATSDKTKNGWAKSEPFPITPAETGLVLAFDLNDVNNIDTMTFKVRFLNASGAIVDTMELAFGKTNGRKTFSTNRDWGGIVSAVLMIGGNRSGAGVANFEIKNVLVAPATQSSVFFHGGSGTNYFWTGTTNNSASVYHPPKDCFVVLDEVIPIDSSADYNVSAHFRSSGTARNVSFPLGIQNSAANFVASTAGTPAADSSGAWTRMNQTLASPATGNGLLVFIKVAAVPRGEYHYMDSVLIEKASAVGTYFDGNTTDTSTIKHEWTGTAHDSYSTKSTYPTAGTIPPAETKAADTLICSTRANNQYNFGFFYTFSNEIGESAASRVTQVRTKRAWPQWAWETPNAAGEPSGTETSDAAAAADQLVAIVPTAAFQAGLDAGATHWNLYVFTWSDQDPVPVTALRVGRRELTPTSSRQEVGWIRVTAEMADAGDLTAPVPQVNTRYNYSDPSRGGQGLVAADRMIMVFDPTAQNVVRWSSNQVGQYTDFSASRGGGYKTLTYGNLFVPAAVKLWQNPQSVDTLTILCLGVDGRSTSYYMAPSTVSSQSEQTQVMGFEETTATPGTTSPYGVEVWNNALYHPLDEQLMKTTANNYNINHKSQTDQIENMWQGLINKIRIRSSLHDGRLYYLVHNPEGAELEDGCFGNEVWVMDAGAEKSSWSRWLVQGHSLRKIETGGGPAMSIVRPDGIFYFDPAYDHDDVVQPDKTVVAQAIPWYLETNTQGANRAHDAWCQLQQANVTFGFFQGKAHFGVRGLDVNGKMITKQKVTNDYNDPSLLAYDVDDYLLVQRNLKEWFFFAGSVTDEVTGEVVPSSGQISLVQYRYTPISVNVGYEYGSVETFEYGRAAIPVGDRTTDNGVPRPMLDTSRP